MSTRERLTWGGDKNASATLPVEEADRRASAHPATPDEGITHPAGTADPEQDDYKSGDPSTWAEDPTTGPYPNSAHPATPDEGSFHPAAKKAAQELRAAVERKALKCLRIATATLGKNASVREIEAQSLSMMDLSDSYIDQTLSRLAKSSEEDEETDEEVDDSTEEVEDTEDDKADKKAARRMSADDRLLRRLLAEEDMGEDEDEEPEAKEASDKESSDRLAAIESTLATILTALQGPTAGLLAEDEDPMDDDEALLAQMMAEDEDPMDDDEALLAQMMEEEMAPVAGDEDEALLAQMLEDEMSPDMDDLDDFLEDEDAPLEDEDSPLADYIDDSDLNVSLDQVDDPMGLGDEDMGDLSLLANLYTAKKGDDEEEAEEAEEESEEAEEEAEEAEEEAETVAKKKASRKPRKKKASTGARTVGQPTFNKTASSEVADLAKLWKTAPDITDVF